MEEIAASEESEDGNNRVNEKSSQLEENDDYDDFVS